MLWLFRLHIIGCHPSLQFRALLSGDATKVEEGLGQAEPPQHVSQLGPGPGAWVAPSQGHGQKHSGGRGSALRLGTCRNKQLEQHQEAAEVVRKGKGGFGRSEECAFGEHGSAPGVAQTWPLSHCHL